MTTYTLQITLPTDVPDDVLVEHIGATLKRLIRKPQPEPKAAVKIVAKSGYNLQEEPRGPQGRNHPFDGPLMFDDVVTANTPQDVVDTVFRAIGEDFPHLAELFRAKGAPEPPAEGDWQLNEEDHVGED